MDVSHTLDMAIYEWISSKTIAIVRHCNNWLFINFRAAMKEVICRIGSMEDIETITSRVTSRVNSRQTSRATSRASSIVKLRKSSSNVEETSKFINPSPRKNSQDQSTDLWNFSLKHLLFNFVVHSTEWWCDEKTNLNQFKIILSKTRITLKPP